MPTDNRVRITAVMAVTRIPVPRAIAVMVIVTAAMAVADIAAASMDSILMTCSEDIRDIAVQDMTQDRILKAVIRQRLLVLLMLLTAVDMRRPLGFCQR